jgi:hypothetical protein
VNFAAVLLFVPETRYARDVGEALVSHDDIAAVENSEKAATSNMENEVTAARQATVDLPPPKPLFRLLSPWSGTESNSSYVGLFLRPFPLIAYPAVIWAVIGCEYTRACSTTLLTDLQTRYR